MFRIALLRAATVVAAALLVPIGAGAETLDGVLARAKAASGGDALDAVRGYAMQGTLATGGLTGTITVVTDARDGRFVAKYALGPVTGAEGDDGTVRWTVGAGGEVQRQDSVAGRAAAANARWLASMGYWYPARHRAVMRYAGERTVDGRAHHVVAATPAGGRALELYFAADDARLARIVDRDGTVTTTTTLADYRDVDGIPVAHEQRDGTGDARYDTVQRWSTITRDPPSDAATFAVPAATLADFRIDGDAATVTLPFELVNNHIYVAATLNGQPARMMVDTGGANILTPQSARRLGVSGEGALEGRGVGEGTTSVGLAKLDAMTLRAAHFARPVFYVFDLDAMRDVEGDDFDGIVGFEVFRRFVVEIAYDARELRLHDPARYVADPARAWTPITFADTTPLVRATLDGVESEFTLDTGSRAALTLHSPYVRAHDLVRRFEAERERIGGWGVGGPSRTRPAMLPGLVLGGHRLPPFAGDLYTGTKGAFAQDDVAGNIGGGVLRRFTVTFDYAGRRVAFAPNRDFDRADAPDRSGLWLNRDGDGYRVIECVAASPCARAGLRADDRIVRFDGRAAGDVPLPQARMALRGAKDTRIALTVRRGDAMRDANLVLADLPR